MPCASPDNEYERQRILRIQANQRKMQELGLHTAAQALQQTAAASRAKAAPQPRKRHQQFEIEVEVRRSGRLRGNQPESYAEDQMFKKIGIDRVDLLDGPRRRRVNVDPVRLAELRESRAREAGDEAPRGPFDSGKGVRIQGGRVYDSMYGVTCHWCRQKTLEDHVTCTDPDCGGGHKLPVSFCKMCLMNRHGEDIAQAEASACWVCPPCRGSCGEGCTLCCNCGPCRKKAGLGPTHQLIKEARGAGFGNVHDYLVHNKTREAAADIAARKEAHIWGAWLKVPYEPTASDGQEEEQQQQGGESGVAAPPAVTAAAGALLQPEEQQEQEEGSPSRVVAAASRRVDSAVAAVAAGRRTTQGGSAAAKVSTYYSAAKESEDSVALAAAAKVADAKLTRKDRMLRKLGLVSWNQ